MTHKLTFAASALSILMATAATAAVTEVREIDVTLDLAAVQNENAAAYWGSLEGDLEGALALRLAELVDAEAAAPTEGAADRDGAVAEQGTRVLVEIREVELTNAFGRNLDLGEAVLVGQVNIVDQADNSNNAGYELSVSLENAGVVPTAGKAFMLNTDDRVTYQLLVDAFADGVVERLNLAE